MTTAHITIIGRHDPNWPNHAAVREAIIHAEFELGVVLPTKWLIPEELENPAEALAGTSAAIIAPDDPKAPLGVIPEVLTALEWLRRRRLPTLAIQSGFHHMVIELARNVLGHKDANATRWDEQTTAPVVSRIERRWSEVEGTRPHFVMVNVHPGTQLAGLYGQAGDHREAFHEAQVVNPDYAAEYERAGFAFSATLERGEQHLLAALESPELPYWIGVAFQPQVTSSAGRPHPLIRGLIEAARRR